jgi:hypothetical protein
MRGIFWGSVLLAMTAIPTSASAEDWRYVGRDSGNWDWHIDVDSFHETPDYVYIWTKTDTTAVKEYRPARRLYKIDCANNTYRLIQLVAYQMPIGRIDETQNWPDTTKASDFTTPKPGGITEKIVAQTCMFDG